MSDHLSTEPVIPRPMAEDQIRASMDRAMAEDAAGVPLEQRTPTTPPVDGVVLCKDGLPMYRVPGHGNDPKATTRCATVEHDGELPPEVLGKRGRTSVCGRATQGINAIPVQRIDLETGEVTQQEAHVLKTAAVQAVDPSTIVYADRPAASDGELGTFRPDFEVSAPARVGVVPTQRSVTSTGPQPAAPAPARRPPQEMRFAPAPTAEAVPAMPPSDRRVTPKTRVTLSGGGIGTMRLKVDYFAASKTCVVLGYVDDDALVYEPPVGKRDEPLLVECNGSTFPCVHYGLTAPLIVNGTPLLLVVLVRTDQ